MNIICGVLKQTEGEVYIKGINLRENPVEAKKHLGFLPPEATPAYGFDGGGVFGTLCQYAPDPRS